MAEKKECKEIWKEKDEFLKRWLKILSKVEHTSKCVHVHISLYIYAHVYMNMYSISDIYLCGGGCACAVYVCLEEAKNAAQNGSN